MIFSPKQCAELKTLLDTSKVIMVIGHRAPDGDAIGSVMALTKLLRREGKTVHPWVPDGIAHNLYAVPGSRDIGIYEGNGKAANEIIKTADVIFCLDFNKLERTGPMSQVLKLSETPKVLVDHHLDPADDFVLSFSDTQASSTCELVYQLAVAMGWSDHIDMDTAKAIYTGLVTDTGSFKYNVHPSTHKAAAALVELGLNTAEVHGELFDVNTSDRLGLLGHALTKKLVHRPEKRASYMTLTKEELAQFNYRKGDTEGLVNYGLSIQDVRFTALASEKDGVVKISFRSKGDLDVNVIAGERFGGGGHKNAAGARSEDGMARVIEIIEEVIQELP